MADPDLTVPIVAAFLALVVLTRIPPFRAWLHHGLTTLQRLIFAAAVAITAGLAIAITLLIQHWPG